jgi:hypothetical protein
MMFSSAFWWTMTTVGCWLGEYPGPAALYGGCCIEKVLEKFAIYDWAKISALVKIQEALAAKF